MMSNDFLNWQSDTSYNIGLFDTPAVQQAGGTNILSSTISKQGLYNYGPEMAVVGAGIEALGVSFNMDAQISNIYANVSRTRRNIEQMEEALMDNLDRQVRKVSRRHGAQMAKVGASGVGFSGSPLAVMAESHARGMQDYDAIYKQGYYAIDEAYESIYDDLDRAKDVATGAIVSSVGTFAKGYAGVML